MFQIIGKSDYIESSYELKTETEYELSIKLFGMKRLRISEICIFIGILRLSLWSMLNLWCCGLCAPIVW